MDGLWWYLNLVAHRGRSISRPIPVSYFIIVWEVSDAFILIVDNGNELHYCSQTQKYCMTNILCNTVTLPYLIIVIVHCVSLCLKNVTTLSCYNFDIAYMN